MSSLYVGERASDAARWSLRRINHRRTLRCIGDGVAGDQHVGLLRNGRCVGARFHFARHHEAVIAADSAARVAGAGDGLRLLRHNHMSETPPN